MDSLTSEHPIPFEQELGHVKSYLNLIQQMYGEGIKVEYEIRTTQFRIPALSLQPLVENAIHKGIRKKEDGGIVTIRTEERKNDFKVSIVDNGVGFDVKILEEEGHIGIQNVKKRLAIMCEGCLNISSKIGEGTVVDIIIPKKIGGGKKTNEILNS